MAPKSAYIFTLLSEYTHTLDSLPLDLSKNFADLRELDAVLSSSISGITTKIYQLIDHIEDPRGTPAERLFFLREIAEEAGRLKLGGDDKIRVACHASDNLHAHQAHLANILRHASELDPAFKPERLMTRTTYPHVSARSLADPSPLYESGRRKRIPGNTNGNRSSLVALESPAKKKKLSKDDEEVAQRREKDRDLDKVPYNHRERDREKDRSKPRVQRKSENPRPGSPTESLLSITSSLPIPSGSTSHRNARSTGAPTNGGGAVNAGSPHARPDTPRDNTSLLDAVLSRKDVAGAYTNGGAPMALPAISHPSLAGLPTSQQAPPGPNPPPSSVPGAPPLGAYGAAPSPYTNPPDDDSAAANGTGTGGEQGDDQGDDAMDNDDRTYCICDTPSYGEMVACDNEGCEREWFHLGCLGLTVPPKGTWFCDACKSKRAAERAKKNRGGKKRTMTRGAGRGRS